jgi:hypothetical protein
MTEPFPLAFDVPCASLGFRGLTLTNTLKASSEALLTLASLVLRPEFWTKLCLLALLGACSRNRGRYGEEDCGLLECLFIFLA